MKTKKGFALLLALVICMGQLPITTAKAAVTPSDAQAYLDVLNRTKPDSSFLIDFDGDGRDELLAAYENAIGEWPSFSIWKGDKAILNEEIGEVTTIEIYKKGNQCYLGNHGGYADSGWWRYGTIQNAKWTYIFDGSVSEEWLDFEGNDYIDYYKINGKDVTQAEYDKVRTEYENFIATASYQFCLINGAGGIGPLTPGNVRPQLEETVKLERVKNAAPEEILAQIAYIGDRSKCKMDTQMANAYAEVIERQSKRSYEDNWGHYTLYAALADIADDGYPILITAFLDKSPDSFHFDGSPAYGELGEITVWGYQNGAAYDAKLPWLDYENGYGILNGKGTIYIREFFHDIGHGRHRWYYTVSKGQIKLAHTLIEYDAYEGSVFVDDTLESTRTVAIGDAPEGASYILSEYELDATKLTENGWIETTNPESSYRSWDLTLFDGVNVTKQSLSPDRVYTYENDGSQDAWILGSKVQFKGELAQIADSGGAIAFDTTAASIVAAALRAYAENASGYSGFLRVTEDEDAYVRDVAQAVADAVGGEISGIYKLADGVYYVVIVVDGGEKGALVRGVKENGKITWKVTQQDDAPVSQEALESLAAGVQTRPNMALDYGKVPDLATTQDILDYLQDRLDNMEGLTPNDAAKTDLAAFVESAISNQAVTSVSGKNNRLTVDAAAPGQLATQAKKAWGEIQGMLGENGVILNKDVTVIIRILWQDADWSKPCQLTLNSDLVDALDGCTVQLLLADGRHYVQLPPDRLKALVDRYGSLVVQMSRTDEGVYVITFLDGEGEVIDRLSQGITVGLPADSMTSTVMASYAGGSDNWGGQYDPASGVLSFETRYSGQYEVLENNADIGDIGALSEESQTAIRFLVSKGFLTLEGDSFRPGEELNRYDFTQALVGMFFALDRSLTTDFPDVPADSPYYPYVASAQHDNIVNGYGDGTFSGADPITREQVLALAARTLVEKKGYTLPQDIETYLSGFADRQDISAWAEDQVALAVREGVASRGSVILPLNNITREQAAIVLYRLFLLLYEVRPVALEVPKAAQTGSPAVVAAVAVTGVVAAAGGGAGAFLWRKKKLPGGKKKAVLSGKKD